MNKLILAFLALSVCASSAFAGTTSYSGKEMKQTVQQAPCPEWYGDREWNVSLWGAYAFTGTENDRTDRETADDNQHSLGTFDRFLGGDHAWGGGIDAKYFFHRYFGIGIEGFGLAGRGAHLITDHVRNTEEHYVSDDHAVGGALGTFTLRYPFHCSRFSPFVWGGAGGVFGGRTDRTSNPFFRRDIESKDESRFVGQFGGGLEVRITPHIGLISDFSWNVVDGPDNNFGMVRSGVNFAF